jgi:hypothetical protein
MGADSRDRAVIMAAIAAMMVIVIASNILVQYPVNDWLTWGAFTYPLAFLVNDLANRHLGPWAARRVVYVGFALAVLCSMVLATPRIALASGTAFLVPSCSTPSSSTAFGMAPGGGRHWSPASWARPWTRPSSSASPSPRPGSPGSAGPSAISL